MLGWGEVWCGEVRGVGMRCGVVCGVVQWLSLVVILLLCAYLHTYLAMCSKSFDAGHFSWITPSLAQALRTKEKWYSFHPCGGL